MRDLSKLILQGENIIGVKGREGSLRSTLRWNAGSTFTLKVASTALIFLMNLLLAHLLGTTGYGTYAYALAWFSIVSVLSVFGLDKLLLREMAVYKTRSSWQLMSGLLRWSNFTALVGSAGIILLAGIMIWIVSGRLESQMGIGGRCCCTATTVILWNILLTILVYRRLGIHSTALGEIRLWKQV